MGLMKNMDKQKQSGKQFHFSLMEVKLNLLKLFVRHADVAKRF